MKKYKSILKDRNGNVKREFGHDTRSGAETWCRIQEYDANLYGWYTEIEEFDYEFEKPAGFDDFLARVKEEVERIGRGYSCNFMWRGYNEHHINGRNHFCFSLEGDKVHPLSVGGSLVDYTYKDFTKDEFISMLQEILIAPETEEQCSWSDIDEDTIFTYKNTGTMTTKEEIEKTFKELNDDANKRWENERILELCNYKEEGDIIKLTVGIGKFDTTYHDIVVDDEGIEVVRQSEKNKIIDDVIHYFLNPIFFGK